MFFDELIRREELTDSEVAYFDAVFLVDQNVVQFDVSVKDLISMQMMQALTNLLENCLEVLFTELPVDLESVEQVLVVHVLEHQKHPMLGLEDFVEIDNEFRLERVQNLDFLIESLAVFVVLKLVLFEALQSHWFSAQNGVGQVDLGIASLAEKLDDVVELQRGLSLGVLPNALNQSVPFVLENLALFGVVVLDGGFDVKKGNVHLVLLLQAPPGHGGNLFNCLRMV